MDRRLFFPQEKGVGLLAHLDALADRRMLPPLTGMSWIPILLPFLRAWHRDLRILSSASQIATDSGVGWRCHRPLRRPGKVVSWLPLDNAISYCVLSPQLPQVSFIPHVKVEDFCFPGRGLAEGTPDQRGRRRSSLL